MYKLTFPNAAPAPSSYKQNLNLISRHCELAAGCDLPGYWEGGSTNPFILFDPVLVVGTF